MADSSYFQDWKPPFILLDNSCTCPFALLLFCEFVCYYICTSNLTLATCVFFKQTHNLPDLFLALTKSNHQSNVRSHLVSPFILFVPPRWYTCMQNHLLISSLNPLWFCMIQWYFSRGQTKWQNLISKLISELLRVKKLQSLIILIRNVFWLLYRDDDTKAPDSFIKRRFTSPKSGVISSFLEDCLSVDSDDPKPTVSLHSLFY